jgi:hypothetical protein
MAYNSELLGFRTLSIRPVVSKLENTTHLKLDLFPSSDAGGGGGGAI